MPSVALVTVCAPSDSTTSSGCPKSCEEVSLLQAQGEARRWQSTWRAVTQTPEQHRLLVPPARHREDAARLSGVALP